MDAHQWKKKRCSAGVGLSTLRLRTLRASVPFPPVFSFELVETWFWDGSSKRKVTRVLDFFWSRAKQGLPTCNGWWCGWKPSIFFFLMFHHWMLGYISYYSKAWAILTTESRNGSNDYFFWNKMWITTEEKYHKIGVKYIYNSFFLSNKKDILKAQSLRECLIYGESRKERKRKGSQGNCVFVEALPGP